MPGALALIPAVFGGLFGSGIGEALIGLGTSALGSTLFGGPSFNFPKAGTTGPQPLSAADQQRILVSNQQQFPNLQEQGGGSLSPQYLTAMSQLLSGTAGQPGASGIAQQAFNNWFGLGGGTSDIGASAGGLGPLGNAFAWGGTPTGGTSTGLTSSTLTSGGGGLTGAGGNFVSQMIDELLRQQGLGSPGAFA